jgi:SNF2 family DNA or RNA helicase
MSDPKSLEQQVADLQAQLAAAKEVLKPLNNEELELNANEVQLKRAYEEQMATIRKRKEELREQKYKTQTLINYTQNQISQAAIEAQKLKEAELLLQKQKEKEERDKIRAEVLEKRFDLATAGAPWREWAKDHQISAGHYLTENRYVILADPMGLGKTLSSVITADMVEKVTKDASPDTPFLGVEEQVFVPTQTTWTKRAVEAALNREWPFKGPLASNCVFNAVNAVVPNEEVQKEITPFDSLSEITKKPYNIVQKWQVLYRGRKVEEGSPVASLQYDLKQTLLDKNYLVTQEAHYETKIVNSVTRRAGKKILYFCPSPLLRNVLEEWRQWSPHRNVTFIGGMSKKERQFALSFLPKLDDYVIIVNYEAWRRDKNLLEELAECKFDTIIVDEAHMVKDPKTGAYKGVRQVIDACQPEYIIPMTGTPILNRPQELFWILTLVNPKEFRPDPGGERDFLWKYCEEYYLPDSSTPRYRFKPGGLDLLLKQISKNILRRTKKQAGIVLPDKTIVYHELDRDDEGYPEQAKARKHMKEFATIVIDANAGKAIQATVMIALLTRLRQIETWPAGIVQRDKITKEITLQLDVQESQKIDYIIRKEDDDWEGLIPNAIEEERIIVFSQFKAPLHELRQRVEAMGYKAAVFDGDTSQALRDEIRYDFDRAKQPENYKPKYNVLLCNYKAAGVGLNLTGATQLITLDEEWNPGKREQAWDRIHRIGQTENVTIHVIRTKQTVDTWLASIIEEKESVVTGFESAVLSTTDFKDALDSGLI